MRYFVFEGFIGKRREKESCSELCSKVITSLLIRCLCTSAVCDSQSIANPACNAL